jgi:hypothetical protein
MCRNIRVLHHFKPPATEAEIHAASLQFVRKVSGLQKPNAKELAVLERAAAIVAKTTHKLLHDLPVRGEPRTREAELEKARAKWIKREEQMFRRFKEQTA